VRVTTDLWTLLICKSFMVVTDVIQICGEVAAFVNVHVVLH
jgi:hypothetical protein